MDLRGRHVTLRPTAPAEAPTIVDILTAPEVARK
jgi:hypothetical protein